MLLDVKYERLISDHLEKVPQDNNYINLLLQNEEFCPDDRGYGSWLNFNLNGINRCEDFIHRIEKTIGSIKNFDVLDIGAGGGGASIAFQNHGCNVTANEINNIRIKWLQTRIRDHNLPIPIITQPIEKFNKKKFDLIYCNAVLEHVSNWKTFLRCLLEINRGLIYLTWPNKYSPLQILSDSHYALFGTSFLTGNFLWLQKYYLKLMRVKRNAWVTSIPSLSTVKRFIYKIDKSYEIKHFLPSSYEKINRPDEINYKPARLIITSMKMIRISNSLIARCLIYFRPGYEIILRKAH